MEAELLYRPSPLIQFQIGWILKPMIYGQAAFDVLNRSLSDFYVDIQQRSQPSRLTSPDQRSQTNPTKFNQRNTGSVRLRDAPFTQVSSSSIIPERYLSGIPEP